MAPLISATGGLRSKARLLPLELAACAAQDFPAATWIQSLPGAEDRRRPRSENPCRGCSTPWARQSAALCSPGFSRRVPRTYKRSPGRMQNSFRYAGNWLEMPWRTRKCRVKASPEDGEYSSSTDGRSSDLGAARVHHDAAGAIIEEEGSVQDFFSRFLFFSLAAAHDGLVIEAVGFGERGDQSVGTDHGSAKFDRSQ